MRVEQILAVAIAICSGAGLFFPSNGTILAQPAKTANGQTREWGAAEGGLRTRIVAVAAETDEQKPDISKAQPTSKYATPEKVTLLVELQNVGHFCMLSWSSGSGTCASGCLKESMLRPDVLR